MASQRTLAVDRTRWLLVALLDDARAKGEIECSALWARLRLVTNAVGLRASEAKERRGGKTRRLVCHHGAWSARRQLVYVAQLAARAYARELAGEPTNGATITGNEWRREIVRAEW